MVGGGLYLKEIKKKMMLNTIYFRYINKKSNVGKTLSNAKWMPISGK